MKFALVTTSFLVAIANCFPGLPTKAEVRAYRAEVAKWRAENERDLKKEEGWLSVAGLFWLHEGANTLGSDEACDVKLPLNSAPKRVGNLTLYSGSVTLRVADGAEVKVNNRIVTTSNLRSDVDEATDRVSLNHLSFHIIQRGSRIGVRLFDQNCRGRREFTGERWYPIQTAYRVSAKFVPYNPPKPMSITNVLGDVRQTRSPGYAEFLVGRKVCRLDAEASGDGLFFNFSDLTSGESTYGAGRFLDSPKPKSGKVELDFNRATNPPCAFTRFATCPLPPTANHLSVKVLAGEKTYHHPTE